MTTDLDILTSSMWDCGVCVCVSRVVYIVDEWLKESTPDAYLGEVGTLFVCVKIVYFHTTECR